MQLLNLSLMSFLKLLLSILPYFNGVFEFAVFADAAENLLLLMQFLRKLEEF